MHSQHLPQVMKLRSRASNTEEVVVVHVCHRQLSVHATLRRTHVTDVAAAKLEENIGKSLQYVK